MYQEIYKPKVIYGSVEGYQKREYVEEYILAVHQDIADVKNRYIRLGFHLNEINKCKYYHDVGYSDFYEFCKNNYGLSKTETSRCINIMVRFCRRNEGCPGNVTMFLDKKYEQYSYSQLGEMLSLDDFDILKISPSMTVKDIRDFKKRKKRKRISAERSDVGTEEPKEKQPITPQNEKEFYALSDIYCVSDVEALIDEYAEHLEKCEASGNEKIIKRNTILNDALFALLDEIKMGRLVFITNSRKG